MRVSASLIQDYLYQPEYGELQQLNALFPDVLELVAGGYTYASYRSVPVYVVKGREYFGVTAGRTIALETKQAMLHELGLALETVGGTFIKARGGLYLPARGIGHNPLGVMADHIPQVMGVYPSPGATDRVCVAVNGDYDIARHTFVGQMTFSKLGDLWKGR